MIYVLEGPDGTGKSTLAKALAKETHAMVIHPYYNDQWEMKGYLTSIIKFAEDLNNQGINVVLDRWCISELIYGTIFRGGPAFDVPEMVAGYGSGITWIYCRNDNAAANHLKNKKERDEMFADMTEVAELYDKFIEQSDLDWHVFDFDKINTDDFIAEVAE